MLDLVRIHPYRVFRSYPFVSTVKILKEGRQLHHDDLKQRNEDINVLDRPLQEEQARMRRRARFVTKPSPLTPLLNLGTRFLVVEENCATQKIHLHYNSANAPTSPRLLLI